MEKQTPQNNLVVKIAKQQGRDHKLDDLNMQDASIVVTFIVNGKTYIVSFLADGSSSGKYSEVGANLAVSFALLQTRYYIEIGIPIDQIPKLLYWDLVDYVKKIVSFNHFKNHEADTFIGNYFLFTLIGFIIGPEETIVMAAGDGLVIINDDIHFRNENNQARYLSYHAMEPASLNQSAFPLPRNFDVYPPIATDSLQKLAIGSDAWLEEKNLIPQIWGHKGSAQLQLDINVLSDQYNRFTDDVSIIVVERHTTTNEGEKK